MRRVLLCVIAVFAVSACFLTTSGAAKPTCKKMHEQKGCALQGSWFYGKTFRREYRPHQFGTSHYAVDRTTKKAFEIRADGLTCGDGNFIPQKTTLVVGKRAHVGSTYTASTAGSGYDMSATVTFSSAQKAQLSLKYTIHSTTPEGTTDCPGSDTRTLKREG